MPKFQVSIKKEVEFQWVLKKNSCGLSIGIGFLPWNFCATHRISRGKSLFSSGFLRGKWQIEKFQGGGVGGKGGGDEGVPEKQSSNSQRVDSRFKFANYRL